MKIFIQQYFSRPRIVIFLGIALFISIHVFIVQFWSEICSTITCDYETRNDVLRPLREATYYIPVLLSIFLFIPKRYFIIWSIGVPLLIALWIFMMSGVDSISGGTFFTPNRTVAAQQWGYVAIGLTLVFVVSMFLFERFRIWRKKRNKQAI